MSDERYSVHDEADFARVYDEDEELTVRRGDLRALLDVATGSLDFGSGFLDNEQVEIMRALAVVLDIDPNDVTPRNFACQYGGHSWYWWRPSQWGKERFSSTECWRCFDCGVTNDAPESDEPEGRGADQ